MARAAESARAGVRLVACFLLQVNTSCNVWGNSTEYRHAPTEEDLSRAPQLVSVPHQEPRGEERGCLSSSSCSLSTGACGASLCPGLKLKGNRKDTSYP